MAGIKGLAVQARLDYLAKRFGADGLQRVIVALPRAHREAIERGILISDWYPLELSDGLLGTAERVLGTGDGSICYEIGRASGRKGLTTVHRGFTENSAALEIAEKMARTTSLLWKTHYDSGAFETHAVDDCAIQSELNGIQVRTPWMCHVLRGYLTSHIEVLGGNQVVVTHTSCAARNQERCIWDSRWNP
jgi:predicted hydrocarbon binding protein